jgi:uncharacterized metal-binding protein
MKPLVYSCSGCSNVAQLANDIARTLDRTGHADMSCIAGVGGDVLGLVRIAKSKRPIIAIDGCSLGCVKAVLNRHDVSPTIHYDLSKEGFKKKQHEDFDTSSTFDMLGKIINDAAALLQQKDAAE